MLNQGSGVQNYGFIPSTKRCIKRFRESETLFPSFHGNTALGLTAFDQLVPSKRIHWALGMEFPYDPDPGSKNLVPLGAVMSGCDAPPNGYFSTSQTCPASVKLELPSLQYSDTDLSCWNMHPPTPPLGVDAYFESSPTISVQSDPISPQKSGLLEALVHEAQGVGNEKNKPSERSSNSSIRMPSDLVKSSAFSFCNTEWAGYPVFHFGSSAATVPSVNIPLIDGISLQESSPGKKPTGLNVKLEPLMHVEEGEVPYQLGFCMPDALSGSDLCPGSSEDHATVNDVQ